jgi:hypothetical protein
MIAYFRPTFSAIEAEAFQVLDTAVRSDLVGVTIGPHGFPRCAQCPGPRSSCRGRGRRCRTTALQFTVAKLEQGQREPSLETAKAIVGALGRSLSVFDDVVFGKDASDQPAEKAAPGRPRKVRVEASTKPVPEPSEQKPAKKRGKRK